MEGKRLAYNLLLGLFIHLTGNHSAGIKLFYILIFCHITSIAVGITLQLSQ